MIRYLTHRTGVRHEIVDYRSGYYITLCGGCYYRSTMTTETPVVIDCYRCKSQHRAIFTPLAFDELRP